MELLNRIQGKLKVPKNQRNTFGNYNYRNAEDILEAVKPHLGSGTLTLTDAIVMIGERYYVQSTAFLKEGDESASTTAFARESDEKKGMDAAQITGAASSYARKYALNGLFLIDDTKDADSDEASTASQPRQEARTATKPAPAKKDAAIELKASKDRLVTLLGLLGHKGLKTKKEYEDAVFDLTGYILADKDIDAINEKLAALVETADAKK